MSHKSRFEIVLGSLLLAATLFATTSAYSARQTGCAPWGTIVGSTVRFCGPATAKLSIFPGLTFRNGTCSTKRSGAVAFTLKLGVRTQDAKSNSGLAFYAITVTGSLSHPTGGTVVAFAKGKGWIGGGTSFRGTATSGSFTARGLNGRTATGTYHC